jgi:hypothetical protein
MSLSQARHHRGRVTPQVEALEDRSLLSVTIVGAGTPALTITAVSGSNNVSIMDVNGTVTVTANGVSQGTFAGVTSIDYEGNNFKDTVSYILEGSAGPGSVITGTHNVIARLKGGNDSFSGIILGSLGKKDGSATAQVSLGTAPDAAIAGGPGADSILLTDLGNVWAGSSLTVFAKTGPSQPSGGTDTLSVNLFGGEIAGLVNLNLFGTQGSSDKANINVNVFDNVDAGGTLFVTLTGGSGQNIDNVNYTGQVKGQLFVTVDGGASKDTLSTRINLNPGSNGLVSASEEGFGGNDTLDLQIHKLAADPVTVFNSTADGGSGTDTGTITSNVTPLNIEHLTVVPV